MTIKSAVSEAIDFWLDSLEMQLRQRENYCIGSAGVGRVIAGQRAGRGLPGMKHEAILRESLLAAL